MILEMLILLKNLIPSVFSSTTFSSHLVVLQHSLIPFSRTVSSFKPTHPRVDTVVRTTKWLHGSRDPSITLPGISGSTSAGETALAYSVPIIFEAHIVDMFYEDDHCQESQTHTHT